MQKHLLFLIVALLTPWVAYSADISGFVRNSSNKPIAKIKVQYICNGKKFKAVTNKYGRYRVRRLPNVTWCRVLVNGKKIKSPLKVNSGSGSKEVNLKI